MLSTTFAIFNATKALPPRNSLPVWAQGQQTWPQITLLCISCVSMVICVGIFWSYWRGGHNRAQKTAVYYTTFAIGFFIFSTVMWIIGAVILHSSRSHSNNQDMWGWACNDNKRRTLFQDEVHYALVCRLQVSFRSNIPLPKNGFSNAGHRTGLSSAPSSKSSSKSSRSLSMPSCSTASAPSAAFTNP